MSKRLELFTIQIIVVFLILSIGIISAGSFYYFSLREDIKKTKEKELAAISDLKIKDIQTWKSERLGDAAIIYGIESENHTLLKVITNPKDIPAEKEILSLLKLFQSTYHYYSISLYNTGRQLVLSLEEQYKSPESSSQTYFDECVRTKSVLFTDIHKINPSDIIHLSLMIPVIDYPEKNPQVKGVLVMRMNPYYFLYPLIQSWPTPSFTGESLLIRRDGNDVIYLNELRFQTNTALRFRYSIESNNILPAVMAAKGRQGIAEGIDYRGKNVISFIKPVPGTQWYLVVKEDWDEIYAPVRKIAWMMVSVISLIIATSGMGIIFFWGRQRAIYALKQSKTDTELDDSRKHAFFLADIIEHSSQPFAVGYPDGRLGFFNSAFMELVGYHKEELAESDWAVNLTPPEWLEVEREKLEELNLNHIPVKYEKEYYRKNGTRVPIELLVHAVTNEKNRVLYYYSFINDITERRKSIDALRESERKFRSLFENMIEGAAIHEIIYDEAGNPIDYIIIDINPAYSRQTGLLRDAVIGKKASEAYSTGTPPYFDVYYRVVSTMNPESFETYFDPLKKYFKISVFSPEINRFDTIFEDITGRKVTEEKLKYSLNEKEALIRELYHRTKNNMQVISSLLKLQAYNTNDEHVSSVFKDMENRIRSMALVHQKLYQSQNLSSINLGEYIKDLISLLMNSYKENSKRIELSEYLEDVNVLIDIAIPCGLVINELITNSIKHAFPGERQGRITVLLKTEPGDMIKLQISDNGIGFLDEFDIKNTGSMGLQTVFAIVESQLQGTITLEKKEMKITILFKNLLYNERV